MRSFKSPSPLARVDHPNLSRQVHPLGNKTYCRHFSLHTYSTAPFFTAPLLCDSQCSSRISFFEVHSVTLPPPFTESHRGNSLSFIHLHRKKLASGGETARKLYTKICGELFSHGFRLNSTLRNLN